MSFWQLYWITRLDSVCTMVCVFWVLILISLLISIPMYISESTSDFSEEDKLRTKNEFKFINYLVVGFIVLSLLSIFVPSNKDILTIYSAQWATNSEEVKKLPDNTVKAINTLLEDYIKKDSK